MKVDLSGRRGLAAGDLTFWVAASLVGGDPKVIPLKSKKKCKKILYFCNRCCFDDPVLSKSITLGLKQHLSFLHFSS